MNVLTRVIFFLCLCKKFEPEEKLGSLISSLVFSLNLNVVGVFQKVIFEIFQN